MADPYRMDGNKMLWHLDRVNAFSKGRKIAPIHVEMGITTGCNLGCTYCYGTVQGRTTVAKRFDMSAEVLTRFLRDAKNADVRSVGFIGEGENTLNPALYEGLEVAKEIGLDVSLATNAVLLPEDKMDLMLTALTWLRVNISAANHEMYLKIHQVPMFDRVIANVEKLIQARRERNRGCTIGLQMIMTRENLSEIVPLAKIGKELGVDYFVVKACSDTPDRALNSSSDEYLGIENVLNEAESLSNANYSVIIKWEKIRNRGIRNYDTCHGTQFIIAISGDGSVFPCGHWFQIRREEFLMGNIIHQPFREILSSERYWEVQRKIQSVNVHRDCEINCRHHSCNQFLAALKTPPEHKNFV
jgi:radical SAM protein with 4Fe4S-binding SPASM domain